MNEHDAGRWHSFHIFYAANPRPVLRQCVGPLVAELIGDGLIDGHFFINYWLGGPHVRLRLKSASADFDQAVDELAEQAIAGFLRQRPSLYAVPSGFLDEVYSSLFELEFAPDERARHLGPDGRMRLHENNTFTREVYEPEYGRYGGLKGVELAEWHFRHSSDLVVDAARSVNLHLRTVTLGFAAQLMTTMTTCLMPDPSALSRFLEDYQTLWITATSGTPFASLDQAGDFAKAYQSMDESSLRRFARVRSAVAAGDLDRLPAFLREWAEHCLELRERVSRLAERGRLVFDAASGDGKTLITDPEAALARLARSYVHMTNNRLSLALPDEAYLAFLLQRSLEAAAA